MSLEEADRIMGLSSLLFRGFQDFLAAEETVDYLAVVAQVDVALQAVRKGVFIRVQNLVINDQGVKIVAGLEAANLAEEASGADVTAQSHAQAFVQEGADGGDTRGKVEVGRGAVGHPFYFRNIFR